MSYSYDVIFSNNPKTTLSGSISPTDTSAVLGFGSGQDLPILGANQAFTLTFTDSATGLDNEIVLVTGFNNATNTITSMLRGQEGTTPQYWNSGDLVNNLITAEYLNGLVQDQEALNGFLPVSGGTMTGAVNLAQPTVLASASTVYIGGAQSNNIIITGGVSINSFDSITEGATRSVNFTGSLVLINSSSLILPNNGLNITTNPGDSALFLSQGNGVWKCINYQRLNGQALSFIAQEQSNWTETNSAEPSYIKNKPTLSLVATTGNYNDLINKPTSSMFAPGATWKNLTGSRASGTVYTNTTGYCIAVGATGSLAGPQPSIDGYVNGVLVSGYNWQFNGAGARAGCFIIVPNGATYRLDFSSCGVANWVEMY